MCARRLWEFRAMKTKVLASAAALAGAGALLAGPGLTAPSPIFSGGADFDGGGGAHMSGGGHMSGGAHMSGGGYFGGSGHFAPSGRSGAWRGGTWSGSGWGGHHRHFINVFYIDPGFGFWDPFFWETGVTSAATTWFRTGTSFPTTTPRRPAAPRLRVTTATAGAGTPNSSATFRRRWPANRALAGVYATPSRISTSGRPAMNGPISRPISRKWLAARWAATASSSL